MAGAIPQLAVDRYSNPIQLALQPSTVQNVATTNTGSAVIANPIAAQTTVIRVVVTTDSYVAFGTAPTADSTQMILPAGVVEYYRMDAGSNWKVAARAVTTAGFLSVTEMV